MDDLTTNESLDCFEEYIIKKCYNLMAKDIITKEELKKIVFIYKLGFDDALELLNTHNIIETCFYKQ